jgi:hypothetical protein
MMTLQEQCVCRDVLDFAKNGGRRLNLRRPPTSCGSYPMTFTQTPSAFTLRQTLPPQVHSVAGMQVSATGGTSLPTGGLLESGIWPAGQAWQVPSGAASWFAGQVTQTASVATWCAPQETHVFLSVLGTWKAGHETQVFPSEPPTIWSAAHSTHAVALVLAFAHIPSVQVWTPVDTWCGPQDTHAAAASPIVPTKMERAGQPVNVQVVDGSLPAGGAPMKPGIEGLAPQTLTISAIVIFFWAGASMLFVQ